MQIRQKLHQNGLINWTNEIADVPWGNKNFSNCKLPQMANKYVDNTWNETGNWRERKIFTRDKELTTTNNIFEGTGYKIFKQQ